MRTSFLIASFLVLSLVHLCSSQVGQLLLLAPVAAYGGLVTGIIGTVFGSIAVKLLLTGGEEEYYATGYGGGYGHDAGHGYGGGYDHSSYAGHRRKRSVDVEEITEADVDQTLNDAYARDQSHCADKLMCGLAARAGDKSHPEYKLLAETILANKRNGYAYREMGYSLMAGLRGISCEKLFPNCPYNIPQMMETIQFMTRQISQRVQ